MRPKKTTRQKKRIKWLASCTSWTRIGEETVYNEILLTRVSRKPTAYRCETSDDNGKAIVVALEKAPRGARGWTVYLPKGEAIAFKYKKQALKYISDLQVQELPTEEAE